MKDEYSGIIYSFFRWRIPTIQESAHESMWMANCSFNTELHTDINLCGFAEIKGATWSNKGLRCSLGAARSSGLRAPRECSAPVNTYVAAHAYIYIFGRHLNISSNRMNIGNKCDYAGPMGGG